VIGSAAAVLVCEADEGPGLCLRVAGFHRLPLCGAAGWPGWVLARPLGGIPARLRRLVRR
jgi:hypothetical protein